MVKQIPKKLPLIKETEHCGPSQSRCQVLRLHLRWFLSSCFLYSLFLNISLVKCWTSWINLILFLSPILVSLSFALFREFLNCSVFAIVFWAYFHFWYILIFKDFFLVSKYSFFLCNILLSFHYAIASLIPLRIWMIAFFFFFSDEPVSPKLFSNHLFWSLSFTSEAFFKCMENLDHSYLRSFLLKSCLEIPCLLCGLYYRVIGSAVSLENSDYWYL